MSISFRFIHSNITIQSTISRVLTILIARNPRTRRFHRIIQIDLQNLIFAKWKVLYIFLPERIKINLELPQDLFFIFPNFDHLQYHLA